MKLSPYVSELALYDIAGTPGVAADVSHINSKAAVKGYAGAQPALQRHFSCVLQAAGGLGWALARARQAAAAAAAWRRLRSAQRGQLGRPCAVLRNGRRGALD